jgi:hypothetical protein
MNKNCKYCNKELLQKNKGIICSTCVYRRRKEFKPEQYQKELEKKKLHRLKNKTEFAKRDAKYYKKNKDVLLAKGKIRWHKNKHTYKAKRKEWELNNTEHLKEYKKKWYQDNIARIKKNKEKRIDSHRKWHRNRHAERVKSDVHYRIVNNIRKRVSSYLKTCVNKNKAISSIYGLDCTLEEFKTHIESKFQEGMTWANWSKNGWHLDHKIPISAFNLFDPEQAKIALHYTNLQPLWAADNIRKSDKLIYTLDKNKAENEQYDRSKFS